MIHVLVAAGKSLNIVTGNNFFKITKLTPWYKFSYKYRGYFMSSKNGGNQNCSICTILVPSVIMTYLANRKAFAGVGRAKWTKQVIGPQPA